MNPIRITIIGMGPRGLSVLERMLEHILKLPAPIHLQIDIADPLECGQGSHPSTQPDHLLINTVASQVTMFPSSSIAGGENGVSLVQWAQACGYRRIGNVFIRVSSDIGKKITEFDHLPRSLLGEYLSWVFENITARLPEKIRITHRRSRVIDVVDRDSYFDVVLEDGDSYCAHYVFLTIGHGRRKPTEDDNRYTEFVENHKNHNKKLAYFPSPYPIECLSNIANGATVAIQGFGLTAHDVISELTVGRGGSYVYRDNELHYLRSGNEPLIRLFSRNCLPFAARGINQKGLAGRHRAQFFTTDAVTKLRRAARERTGDQRLDFKTEVLPLIIKEMAYAYRTASLQSEIDPDGFEASPGELSTIDSILWPLAGHTFKSCDIFREFFDAMLRDDLAEALKGNLTSPIKAATDVLRDTREVLRLAVEYSGLTPVSHKFFVDEFNPVMNRISFGPPKQRNIEYLALFEAGVIDIAGGPGARIFADDAHACFRIDCTYPTHIEHNYADVLVIARLDPFSPLTDGSRLTKKMSERGLIRPYFNGNYHPGGIDIDTDLHPINAHGAAQQRMWALGFPVEGAHFYTHALPRPQITSRQVNDAERCVLELFRNITIHAARHPVESESEHLRVDVDTQDDILFFEA